MATLTNETIRRLAVLRALSLWKKGAFGSVRLHKVLYFADQGGKDPKQRLFTFKRWQLGQYSDEIADALNALQAAGRIKIEWEGPSDRIEAAFPTGWKTRVVSFFATNFREWDRRLNDAFEEWAYLTNDGILIKAHDDSTYKSTNHGQIIARSRLPRRVNCGGLDEQSAEALTDLVNDRLAAGLRERLRLAAKRVPRAENWREVFFPGEAVAIG